MLDSGRHKGKRVFTVKYTDGDSEDLFAEEVQESLLPVDCVDANNSVTDNKLSASKTKNKPKKKEFVKVTGSRVWFLLDIETTGSKRNWDVPIVWAWIVVDDDGQVLEEREFRVHPGNVSIKDAAYKVHGISKKDLQDEDGFQVVGPKMMLWLQSHVEDVDTGILVAHNGSTDFQFLCALCVRYKLTLPTKITHTFDTLVMIRRFGSLAYRKASVKEWTEFTKKGRISYSVSACATFVLSKRSPPTDFQTVCGMHHDGMADARGLYVLLFDGDELGKAGLEHLIVQQKRPLFERVQVVWDAMVEKCKQPPLVMKPVPDGWHEQVPVGEDGAALRSSATELPEGIEEVPEPKYRGAGSRVSDGSQNPGVVTPQMKAHLRNAGVHCGGREAPEKDDATSLLTQIFLFFFTLPLLLRICLCTNAHANQPVVKEKTRLANGKTKTKYRLPNPGERATGPRCRGWQTLWPGELLVFIGIIFKMGVLWRPRTKHYWSKRVGFSDPIIKSAMTSGRFQQIYANLSFAMPGTSSGYNKIRMVDEFLRERCMLAMWITQHFAVDESMIKNLSRYCSWRQYMARKPIKWGIKVFCLVMSTGFLWNWHIYRGKYDEVLSNQTKQMYYLIFVVLMCSAAFDNRGCILFCDAAFTSLRLFEDLWVKRKIMAVGPINLGKGVKNNNANTWPFQAYKQSDGEYLWRGWDRVAYKKLTRSSPAGCMQALVWKDNKFVTMLSTCYVEEAKHTCSRWIRALGKYTDVVVRLCLIFYAKHMGHVDRCDKNVSLSKIKPRRCKKRYHRCIFYWLLASVGFSNTLAVFMCLFPNATAFEKKTNSGSIGFKYWAQDEMANSFIAMGLRLAGIRRVQWAVRTVAKAFRAYKSRRRAGDNTPLRRRRRNRGNLNTPRRGGLTAIAVNAARVARMEYVNYSPTFQPG